MTERDPAADRMYHMQYLGDTVAKIAGEKAGIIVPGVPVIYDGNDLDAAEVIRARAEELGSPAYEVKRSDTEVLRTSIVFNASALFIT